MSNTLLFNLLARAEFERTDTPSSTPIVIHAVAGAGKSSLLRQLTAYYKVGTAAKPDPPSFKGDHFTACVEGIDILDEYQSAQTIPKSASILFGDPLQDPSQAHFLRPHYLKTKSYRIGPEIAQALSQILAIQAFGSSKLLRGSAYLEDPVGLVIAFEDQVCAILRKHQVEHSHPSEIRGVEVDTVTLYTSTSVLPKEHHSDLYVALTRSLAKTLWLTLDATDAGHSTADV